MKPPANVVTREVFKPFNRMCGATFEILDTMLHALLIPSAVEIMPNIAVSEPINMILSMWQALFKFFIDIKIKNINDRKTGIIKIPPDKKYLIITLLQHWVNISNIIIVAQKKHH